MPTTSKSTTTTRNDRREDRLPPPHPGETLEEMITGNGLTAYRVAIDIGVGLPRVNEIILQRRGFSADMALRLAKYFNVAPMFFMGLQAQYDLEIARDEIEDEVARIQRFDPKTSLEKVRRPREMSSEREIRPTARRAAKVGGSKRSS